MKLVDRILSYLKRHETVRDCLLVAVLTIPAILSLLQGGYFSMHDDQHIVRLFLFDQAIKDGNVYPRWVDGLGFGFGYPLFNFYPPMIYIIGELFHIIGFSLIWSIKMMLILGFVTAALGMFLLVKSIYNRFAGICSAVLYTYFFYHATTVYVRGAFAEFFTMTVLPFLFYSFILLFKRQTLRRMLFTAGCLAALMLTHPLIAFPSMMYVAAWFLFLFFRTRSEKRVMFTAYFIGACLLGFSLSAFFWIPSMMERHFTYVDSILTTELANYAIHFVYPHQFWQSQWGYGGSIAGPDDGMTFQLGKIHLLLSMVSGMVLFGLYILQPKKKTTEAFGMFALGCLIVSILMATTYSKPIWDVVSFLWYLQFPWRFLTFVAIFISIVGSLVFHYLFELSRKLDNQAISVTVMTLFVVTVTGAIVVYGKYFHPQEVRKVTDAQLTSYDEITWRISRSSFEFVPKGVSTKKSELNTTILAIDPEDRIQKSYTLTKGKALVEEESITSAHKTFIVKVGQPITFRLNTFNFPGWEATLFSSKTNSAIVLPITDDNPFKLITVDIPPGEYLLEFSFKDTLVRFVSTIITLLAIVISSFAIWKEKEVSNVLLRQLKKI